jgi:hypothetical protein
MFAKKMQLAASTAFLANKEAANYHSCVYGTHSDRRQYNYEEETQNARWKKRASSQCERQRQTLVIVS